MFFTCSLLIEVIFSLEGLGLLRVAVNHDDAIEDGSGVSGSNAAVRLGASAMFGPMLDQRVVVDVVVAVGEVRPVELALGALPLQEATNVEPKEGASERDDGGSVRAVGSLTHVDATDVKACVFVDPRVAHFGVAAEV